MLPLTPQSHFLCFQSARWELNPRPASYKDAALTVELRASESRVGGNRTHPMRIKSPLCSLYTTTPKSWSGVCVLIAECVPLLLLLLVWWFSGSPGNRTQRNSVISRIWATSPRLPSKSGTPESNRNPPVPKTGVLPFAPLPENISSVRTAGFEPAVSWPPTRRDNQVSLRSDQVVASSPDQPSVGARNRTHLTALKGRHPLPIDERAMFCANRERSGPGGARILVCGSSDRRYAVSATSP